MAQDAAGVVLEIDGVIAARWALRSRALTGRLAQASDLAALGNAGLYSYSATVDDGANPLDGVFVQCATDAGFTNVIATTYSNASGAYTVRSDQAGTHYLRFHLAGWNFSDETVTLV